MCAKPMTRDAPPWPLAAGAWATGSQHKAAEVREHSLRAPHKQRPVMRRWGGSEPGPPLIP